MSSAPFEEGMWDVDSGYVSAAETYRPRKKSELQFTTQHLKYLNSQLQKLEPQDILRWCVASLPGLYQETALGLTGLVILDMLSKLEGPLKPQVDAVFIDTLHHFDETLELLSEVQSRYPDTELHVYKPRGVATADDFAKKYGEKLWETDEELYDYKAKVEPTEHAYEALHVNAAITGRRRTQGGRRDGINIVEVDENGMVKINPLAQWSFDKVVEYVHAHGLPYNALLDAGYTSVGDWHSTQPVGAGEDERAGRWKGSAKTECGIHNPQSRYAQYLLEQEREEKRAELDRAFQRQLTTGGNSLSALAQ